MNLKLIFGHKSSSDAEYIFQQAGLCNGATGTIVTILYDRNVPPPGLPKCIIVDFGESYIRKPFFHDHGQQGWVPIFPTTHSSNKTNGSTSKKIPSSRTMFPLCLCYAWTIWKVQGQTISSDVIANLGDTEKETGVYYTFFQE